MRANLAIAEQNLAYMPSTGLNVAGNEIDALLSRHTAPEPGWASANPDRALAYLFVMPQDGHVADEVCASTL